MATYKYDHAAKVNGKIYPANTDIEIPDAEEGREPNKETRKTKKGKKDKKAASK